MTQSTDTIANYRQSDRNNSDKPIDRFVVLNQEEEDDNGDDEHADEKYGLFDSDEDNLTLFDLKFIPKSDHDLSIFDELAHQCDAVLLATNLEQKTAKTIHSESHMSNLKVTTMMNEYERRFQRSLQKLNIPSWYNEIAQSPKIASKPIIITSRHVNQEPHRTPEIVHVHRPRSYRSCRSSFGTSPSPSAHSWHPNYVMDGLNFSPLLPLSSYTSSRRHMKYEKGIERVAKSSRWYRPAHFIPETKHDPIGGTTQISRSQQTKSNHNHYDVPKSFHDETKNPSHRIRQNFIPNENTVSGLSNQQQSKYLIDEINFNDFENARATKENRSNKSNSSIANDKQYDNYTQSNDFEKMSSANEIISFGYVELEEVTDDEDNDKRAPTNKIQTTSSKKMIDTNDNEINRLLERIATNLVDSILNDALNLKKHDRDDVALDNNNNDDDNDDDDDVNTGVRELSDDETALRELDENDMSGTDEFILFATKAEPSDHDADDDDHENNLQTSPSITRGSLNRLYTFSRTNDDTLIHSSKHSTNQDSSTSDLMIVDKDISRTNNILNTAFNEPFNKSIYLDNSNSINSSPAYRSHIQKRQINLGRYYDGMMRATNSHLPTYDICCDLLTNKPVSSEGVNEETVRQGRILLDSIPTSLDSKIPLNESISNDTIPIRPILKNTRFETADETKCDDCTIKPEVKSPTPTRKIMTTTVTEEYHRIQRKIIEEIIDGPLNEVCGVFDYSSHREQFNTQQSLISSVSINHQSPYESLADCYSGYSFTRSDFLTPVPAPLRSNVSSLQSTTDEAYESEPTTISPRSPTISSSPITTTTTTATTTTTTTTAHIHPNLLHEFEYPSPPPPVPDRHLKPPHLRPPPPVKPRSHQRRKDSNEYSSLDKTVPSPLTTIQHILASSSSNDSTASPVTRLLSSRHYCGSLPVSSEPIQSSRPPTITKADEIPKRYSRTSNDENKQQSNSSSLNRHKPRKPSSTYFEEATNGLAIRLPAPISRGQARTNKQDLNRPSRISSTKRIDGIMKKRPISENLHVDRSSLYETSV
ncbi:unnamed protein product [Rotaria magnacalcarata]|uniref:Uncharacterized protein n=1 Tax=Rotaria magnacalcarata TaxID=392030 RepID=A0A819DTC5_9BILA|nr:unnamed protein product [Rotaria magnacalcarata]CAF3833534.1 unnamed protein product [Rotaria magnacalcarata]